MSLVIAITALAVVGIYDGYCQITGKPTLSALVWKNSVKYPFLPFAFGILAGHLFWSNSGACP